MASCDVALEAAGAALMSAYVAACVNGRAVSSVTLPATFVGSSFGTGRATRELLLPIFVQGGGAALLPIDDFGMNDVTVSAVLLTGQNDGENKCPSSARTLGDCCSLTRSLGGCRDSVWFPGQFAASAVTITSGVRVSLCNGGS